MDTYIHSYRGCLLIARLLALVRLVTVTRGGSLWSLLVGSDCLQMLGSGPRGLQFGHVV